MDAYTYARRGMRGIEGWLEPVDAGIIIGLSMTQHRAGVRGDLLEVGVMHGRSAILLGFLAGAGEHLVLCDPFVPHGNLWPGLNRATFERNYLLYHDSLPTVARCRFDELMVQHATVRLAHLDGSHLPAHVQADLALAREWVVPGGIIVLNDLGVEAPDLELIDRTDCKLYYQTPQ